MLQWIFNEPGIIIGVAIILIATLLLPARIRWYVLTAGAAVVIYRVIQLYWANKRLKSLDNEREQLRGELSNLRSRNGELEKIHQNLLQELERVKVERQTLIQNRQVLDKQAHSYQAELKTINSQLEEKKRETDALIEQGKPIVEYLERFAAAERLGATLPEHL